MLRILDLIAGVLSLVLAGVLWRRREKGRLGERETAAADHTSYEQTPGRKSRRSPQSITRRMLAHGSPKAAFALGLILNLPGIWYLVALKDIAQAKDSAVTAVLLILFFNAIMFLLVEVPLIGYLISPEGTRARVQRFQAWLGANARLVATAVALAIGAYLVIRGVVELTQINRSG